MLRGRLYNRVKKADGQRGPKKLGQNEQASTAAKLSDELGVSEATIRREGRAPGPLAALRGRLYNRVKKAHGGQIPGSRMGKTCPSFTADKLAAELGVSPRTIKNEGRAVAARSPR